MKILSTSCKNYIKNTKIWNKSCENKYGFGRIGAKVVKNIVFCSLHLATLLHVVAA